MKPSDRSFVDAVSDVYVKSFGNYYSNLEKVIREYLRTHRTTRLDIELHTTEPRIETVDDAAFFRPRDSAAYSIRVVGFYRIHQKLPVNWRPNLPG